MRGNSYQKVVIIYHDQCRDGFGAAYAAWKKFGDSATYMPRKMPDVVPEGLTGKELYILDYSYTKEDLQKLRDTNTTVVVIDHHKTAEDAVTAFPENVFDLEHSGAVLAWKYFHPSKPIPTLLLYIEDHDLWKCEMNHNREFGAALGEYTMDFETWDQIEQNFENKELFDSFIRHGAVIAGFEDKLVENLLTFRERAVFDGHDIYVLNATRIYRSILGHRLASLSEAEGGAPFAVVYYRYNGHVNCSLRSTNNFDVRILAEKYGGGGHKAAASIRVDDFAKLPFKFVT